MKDLLGFFRRFLARWKPLGAGFVCIPLAQLGDIGITLVIGDALDRLSSGEPGRLGTTFAVILGLALARGVFRFAQRYWITNVSRDVEGEVKRELFAKLVRLPFAFHDRSRSGDVVSRMTSDVEVVRMFLGPGLMYTAGALVAVPVSLGILLSIHAPLALLLFVPMTLMGLSMRLLFPRTHRESTAVQEAVADIAHRAQENFGGIRVVQGYGREEYEVARFDAASTRAMEAQVRLAGARAWSHTAAHAAHDLSFLAILVLGGLAMIDGDLPAGDLFKFIDLTQKTFWPVIALGWVAGSWPRALASSRRVSELLHESARTPEAETPRRLAGVRGALGLEGVGFTYPGAARPALVDVSVEVPAGTTLGIVGPTGAGKSTLLALVARLYEAEGTIRLDGVDVRELALADLRGALGYVPQDGFLFSDTWRANVAFGAEAELGPERAAELARRAAIDEDLARFADGVDTLVGERGVTLSGGQRQRTAIARALAREPRVLLLDDCLSAVDTDTERRLHAELARSGTGRTVLVVAHRLRTVARADRILVLDSGGRVADVGTHAELRARPGWYRETWRRQEMEAELSEL